MVRRMKSLTICFIVAVTAICTSLSVPAGAQEYVSPPITISKDKVKIDGKVFYSHIVIEKQTLFSISKAYGVSIEDIYKYNPSVKENGLRKNDIINIPVVKQENNQQKRAQDNPRKSQPEVIVRQETPVYQEPVKPEPLHQELATDVQVRYTVNWFDDLESISKKFGVSEDAIIKANNLKNRKLKNRQTIIIPAEEPQEEAEQEVAVEDNLKVVEERGEVVEEMPDDDSWEYYSQGPTFMDMWMGTFTKPRVDISLALPFKANGKSSSKNNMDFYSGVLVAAREAEDDGIELHLNVIDTANDSIGINVMALRESDVIIGPISSRDISSIHALTSGACPLVSPLDQRAESLVAQSRRLIQAPTSQYVQYSDIADWIKEDLEPGDKVIVISEKGARQSDSGKTMVSVVNSKGIGYTMFSYSILEGRNIKNVLKSKMTETGVNRVIVASESEAFVNDAVRNLNLIVHDKYNVVLYAPSKIRSFETIEIDNLHNTSLHASLSYSIDYDSEEVREFIAKYRALFGTEPTQFAIQGYDLTKYFSRVIVKYGDLWYEHLEGEDAEMLQSKMSFKANSYGSYINNGTRRVVYGKGYLITPEYSTPAISSPVENGHSPQPEE